MICQVKVTSMVNSFKLTPAEGSIIFYVCCVFCVMSPFIWFVIMEPKFFRVHSQTFIPIDSYFFKIFKSFLAVFVIRLYKIFKLHLFKLTGTETEVAWGHFIPQSFTDLSLPKMNFNPGGIDNVLKINEDTLSNFAPEIGLFFRFGSS